MGSTTRAHEADYEQLKREPQTLVEVAFLNLRAGGMSTFKATVKAAEAVTIVWAWSRVGRLGDQWPTVIEYSTFWKQVERTSYRELTLFREAFPLEVSPRRIAEAMNARADIALERAAAALSLPANLASA